MRGLFPGDAVPAIFSVSVCALAVPAVACLSLVSAAARFPNKAGNKASVSKPFSSELISAPSDPLSAAVALIQFSREVNFNSPEWVLPKRFAAGA